LNTILNIDIFILDLIQSTLRCGFLDAVMIFFTKIGDNGIIWIVLTLMFLYTEKYRKMGVAMTFALVIALLLGNELLKELVRRPRPFTLKEITLLIPPPSGFSFPSGHTMASFAAANAIRLTHRKIGNWAFLAAFLIAFSRIYLYVHFTTDVICGALFGLLFGYLGAALIYRKFRFYRGK